MDFNLSGGTQVMGFISPFDTNDTYAVIDPLYGIDGFRNVVDLSALNAIPNARRRAGMVVGVSGGTEYYKLKDVTWSGITADWKEFTLGGGEVNTASSVGVSNEVFDQKVGSDLQFRTLSAGTNVTITSGATTLTINSSGGGADGNGIYGGSGSLPSKVDINTNSFDIEMTGAGGFYTTNPSASWSIGQGVSSQFQMYQVVTTHDVGHYIIQQKQDLSSNVIGQRILSNSVKTGSATLYGINTVLSGTHSGGTNVGMYISVTNALNNYGLIVQNGSVGIGTTTPTEQLDVIGNSKISGTLNLGNIGSGTSLTNLGWDSSGNVVSGTTGGSSDGNGIYDGSGSLTTGTTIASGGYDLNITGTGKFGVSGDIQFLSTAALESDTIKIVQSTGTTGTTGGIITFDGQTGGLFAITDDKDGQLFGVADVSGNDIMYADADWLIKMGNPFQLSGSPFELKYDNVSGNTTLSTNAINVNLNVQNITSTGVTSNIDVTKSIIKISTTTSADLLTLPDGVEGQVISIIYVAETAGSDDVTITPTNLLGYTTIFLTLIGTGCELYFTDGSWVVKSQNNVTLS